MIDFNIPQFQLIKRFPSTAIAPWYYVRFQPVGQEPILHSEHGPYEGAQTFLVGDLPVIWIDHRPHVVAAMEIAYTTLDFSRIGEAVYQPAAVKFMPVFIEGEDRLIMVVSDLPDDINGNPIKPEAVLHIYRDMPDYDNLMSIMAQRACFMLGGVGSFSGSVSFLALEMLAK